MPVIQCMGHSIIAPDNIEFLLSIHSRILESVLYPVLFVRTIL